MPDTDEASLDVLFLPDCGAPDDDTSSAPTHPPAGGTATSMEQLATLVEQDDATVKAALEKGLWL